MKPTVPSVIDEFKRYHARECAWGALHIVLDDGNVRDGDVAFCAEYAREVGDTEAARLAETLLAMSKTQRLKIAAIA